MTSLFPNIKSRSCKKQHLVKMKPPWLTRSNRLKIYGGFFGASLLLVANLMSCDSLVGRSEGNAVSSDDDLAIPSAGSEASRLSARSPNGRQQEANDAQVKHPDLQVPDELEFEAAPVEGAPHFAPDQPKRVVASSHQSEVFLPCKIENLDIEQTISWIRKRDSLVLTIDKLRLVDDTRFQLSPRAEDHTLTLAQPRDIDAGFYECQVSSLEPKLSGLIELKMVRAESTISNFSSLFVRPGEPVNLTCNIRAPQRTNYVYWYKNQKEVVLFDNNLHQSTSNSSDTTSLTTRQQQQQQESGAGRKSGPQLKNVISASGSFASGRAAAGSSSANEEVSTKQSVAVHKSSSSLIIKQAQLNDTANYTCVPSNAKASHISLIVIENGLGSQPEKRSLHADSAALSIHRRTEPWDLVKNTLSSTIDCCLTFIGCLYDTDHSGWTRTKGLPGFNEFFHIAISILAAVYTIRLNR